VGTTPVKDRKVYKFDPGRHCSNYYACERVMVKIWPIIPYPREKGPMVGAPCIGPRLGGGPIFRRS
jgi:hypothetical protein